MLQEERYRRERIRYNSQLNVDLIKEYCGLDKDARLLMENAYHKLELSTRSYHRLLKVARTIADIDGERDIKSRHVAEAVMFRGQT